jgi:Methyltransferase FkbM domain
MLKPLKRLVGRVRDYVTFQTTSRAEVTAFLKLIRPHTTNVLLKRFGGDGDGGYLIPDDLKNISVCFSPGVSNCSDFEEAMASLGMTCFLADYSVDGPALENKNFHFEKKFLGPINSTTHTTLFDWVNRNAKTEKDFILQMDIEDSEYDVFESTPSETLQKFQIMTVEFHRFRRVMNKKGLAQLTRVFTKVLEHFVIIHNHPNNNARVLNYRGLEIPLTTEITFLRKDRIDKSWPTTQFPHPLDRPNRIDRPDLKLPDCWYKF